MPQLLDVQELQKAFGPMDAVRSVSLFVDRGAIVAVIGGNGAGKSTTLKMIVGLLNPDSGRIRIDDKDVTHDPSTRKQRISYLPENVVMYEELSGRENLRHLLEIATQQESSSEHLQASLHSAGLQEEAWDRPSGTYSKGMRQKVGIALALARKANLLVLDEPTSGLDPHAATELGRSLKSFADREGGVLMATHDVYRAAEIADVVFVLQEGRIVAQVDPGQLSAQDIESRFFSEVISTKGAGSAPSEAAT